MSIVGQSTMIDRGVLDALVAYLAFGIDPGSFGMALLNGDRNEAYATAHAVLKEEEEQEAYGRPTPTEDIVATMLAVTESAIPSFARGEYVKRWMDHKGLSGAPNSLKAVLNISVENHSILNEVKSKHPEVLEDTPATKTAAKRATRQPA